MPKNVYLLCFRQSLCGGDHGVTSGRHSELCLSPTMFDTSERETAILSRHNRHCFLTTVTFLSFQMFWPLPTTNCTVLWLRIASAKKAMLLRRFCICYICSDLSNVVAFGNNKIKF